MTDPAHPDHTCPTCGVSIDRRAAACRKHRAALFTPDTARAAVEARWNDTPGGVAMTVIQAAPIAPYEAPGYLIEMTGGWKRGRRAVAANEQVKILDRHITGWGPANAVIEVTNRDGWRRHMLAEIAE